MTLKKDLVFGEKVSGIDYKIRTGIYGIALNDDDKIATIKTSAGYFLPGGGLETGESHDGCLIREFIEETGYGIKIKRYLGSSSLYHQTRTNQYMLSKGHFYIVKPIERVARETELDHKLIFLCKAQCIESLFLEHQRWAVVEAVKSGF